MFIMKLLKSLPILVLLLLLLVALVAFLYYSLIYPFLIATQAHLSPWAWITVGVVWLSFLLPAVGNVATIAANVYGVKKYNINALFFPKNSKIYKDIVENEKGNRATIKAMVISYAFFIVWFAFTYLYMGNQLKGMFDQTTVSTVDAFYLSFTAISVGPAGLNPTSSLTKCLVMLEIAVGLIYTITVFSVLVELLRHKGEE